MVTLIWIEITLQRTILSSGNFPQSFQGVEPENFPSFLLGSLAGLIVKLTEDRLTGEKQIVYETPWQSGYWSLYTILS